MYIMEMENFRDAQDLTKFYNYNYITHFFLILIFTTKVISLQYDMYM